MTPIGATATLVTGDSAANASSVPFTTAVDSPAGATVRVYLANEGGIAPTGLTDSAGNTYTAGNIVNGTGCALNVFVCVNALHLPIGSTLTGTWSNANTQRKFIIALSNTGVVAVDGSPTGDRGTSDNPTAQSGALDQVGNELVCAATFRLNGAAGSFVENINFTTVVSFLDNSAFWESEYAAVDQSAVFYGNGLDASANWCVELLVLRGENPGVPSLCALPITGRPPTPTRLGYLQAPTSLGLTTCALLGATEYRIGINNTDDYTPNSTATLALQATLAACRAIGVKVVPDIKNFPPGLPSGYTGTVPADLTVYKAQINNLLDIFGTDIAMALCENEMNGNYVPVGTLPDAGGDYATYYAAVKAVADATSAAYFTELDVFTTACRARGVAVCHGGISDTGATRAYAVHLASIGDLADLTEFVSVTSPANKGIIGNDLPNTLNPTRPVFAANPDALYDAIISTTFITQSAAHGSQFQNSHAFWNLPDICWEFKVLDWTRAQSGCPLVMTAVGQKTNDPRATVALMQLLHLVQPVRFAVFGAFNSTRAFPYADGSGALNNRGIIVRDALAAYRESFGHIVDVVGATAARRIGGF